MNVYKGRLLKKSSNWKSKLVLSTLVHYMAFKHCISFATDLATNFGCYRFRITPDIISKLLRVAIWSSCAVWFKSEQTPFPLTGLQFRPTALHRIRNMLFCSNVIFFLRDQWLIDRLSEAMGAALVGKNFSPIQLKFSFHMKKKGTCLGPKLTKHWNLLSQYHKSGSMFSSSEPVDAHSDCSRLGNTLCLCLPVLPLQAELESSPKSLAVDFAH